MKTFEKLQIANDRLEQLLTENLDIEMPKYLNDKVDEVLTLYEKVIRTNPNENDPALHDLAEKLIPVVEECSDYLEYKVQ